MHERSKAVFILAALLLALAAPMHAQEPDPSPRFFIDAIDVAGLRYASPRVIVAETRLHPGREYSEPELRAGAARAARLPFVVRIDPRIEKGARRGAYRLVLVVTETKPLFFGGTYRVLRDEPDDNQLTAGARAFLGRSGMVHGAATIADTTTVADDQPRYEVGYTQYDLFGSGAFVSALARYGPLTAFNEEVHGASAVEHLTGQLVAGIPLRGNHALRATYTSTPYPTVALRPPVGDESPYEVERISTGELAWIYDSTDDPVLTNRGTRALLSAAVRSVPITSFVDEAPGRVREIDRQPWLTADVRKVWSVAPRQSVSARAGHTYLQRRVRARDYRDTYNQSFVGTSYSYNIWGPERPSKYGDLRFESALVYQYTHLKPDQMPVADSAYASARLGLVFRNEWGVFRLRFDVERDYE